MKCPNCGREIMTDVCYNCGYNVKENMSQEQVNIKNSNCSNTNNACFNDDTKQCKEQNEFCSYPRYEDKFLSEGKLAHKNGMSAEIKTIDWFKFSLIQFLIGLIPIVGPIAVIVFDILFMIRDSTAKTLKNYLKFHFIMTICTIVFVVVAIIVIVTIGAFLSTANTTATNGEIDSLYSFSM